MVCAHSVLCLVGDTETGWKFEILYITCKYFEMILISDKNVSENKTIQIFRHSKYMYLQYIVYKNFLIVPKPGGTLRKVGWGCAAHLQKLLTYS